MSNILKNIITLLTDGVLLISGIMLIIAFIKNQNIQDNENLNYYPEYWAIIMGIIYISSFIITLQNPIKPTLWNIFMSDNNIIKVISIIKYIICCLGTIYGSIIIIYNSDILYNNYKSFYYTSITSIYMLLFSHLIACMFINCFNDIYIDNDYLNIEDANIEINNIFY